MSVSRRDRFKVALLPLIAAGFAASPAAAQPGSGRSLVAQLSRSGNTRVLAGALARRFDADLFELRSRDPWPGDYDAMAVKPERRCRESQSGAEPEAFAIAAARRYRAVLTTMMIPTLPAPAMTMASA